MVAEDNSVLNISCETINGVGPALAKKLAKCGISTVQDLLFHLPYRYQDRTRITPIADLRPPEWAVIAGRVCKTEVRPGKRALLTCYVEDASGMVKLQFFHFTMQQKKAFLAAPWIHAFGEVREFNQQRTMVHPEYQLLAEHEPLIVAETLTPIYPSTQGLTQNRLRHIVSNALTQYQEQLHGLEWMSEEQCQEQNVFPIAQAIELLHNPPPDTLLSSLEEGKHPALRRLCLDELVAQKLSMLFARRQRESQCAPRLIDTQNYQKTFIQNLPFPLTGAQERVIQEIQEDLTKNKPMLRLVQGDVGAGKTVVAALAALHAIGAGYQVALMAPTDLLSEQHTQNLKKWFAPLGLKVLKLSGKLKIAERREVLAQLRDGVCHLVVGTHALFQEEVHFRQLGLIIIDEQHRFGVEQRLSLQQKGQIEEQLPHQLLMTATPIPRTLSMTYLSHLEISIIDELPPGRTPITTAVLSQEKRIAVVSRLQEALAQGRQAYWVCTLIEESEKLQCMAATATAEQLQAALPNARVGLVHGRMTALEKDQIMGQFQQGLLDLLVATTVIEVGVDVPQASLMIIENAERLGLSQLHQLRGRVGRGATQSHCLLLYQAPLSPQGAERLKMMRATQDGFIIAEKDLELRGAGEILGTRQTGYRSFKIADPVRDHELLECVPEIARNLLNTSITTAQMLCERWLGNFTSYLQG